MKQPTIETERLIIRELLLSDAEGLFELESNPVVHRYLGNKPLTTMEQVNEGIEFIRAQYVERGIGRWAVVEKESDKFLGWTGFKINSEWELNGRKDVFDLGYRLVESCWGKGYASESAFACMEYAFENLPYDPIFGAADVENIASNRILQKVGMRFINEFECDGAPHNFYGITKTEWNALKR